MTFQHRSIYKVKQFERIHIKNKRRLEQKIRNKKKERKIYIKLFKDQQDRQNTICLYQTKNKKFPVNNLLIELLIF